MGMGVSASEALDQWYWRNPSPNGNDLNGVAYGNGTFVAVGGGGTIMTSTDGHLWEQQESGFDEQLNQVIFAQNAFLAVGEGGVILSSANGNNWVSHPTDPLYSLRGVTFAQGKYVMVGAKGGSQQLSQIILCSDDLVQWTSRQFPSTHSLSQVTYGNGVFMAIGADSSAFAKATILVSSNGSAAGLGLTVEISSDLQSWQTLRTLGNLSGQTNLLEPVLATNGQRFYRARTSN